MGTVPEIFLHERLDFLVARKLCSRKESRIAIGPELLNPVTLPVPQGSLGKDGLFIHIDDAEIIQDLVLLQGEFPRPAAPP